MSATLIDRRCFLSAAGSLFLATLLPAQREAFAATDVAFASAFRDENGDYGVAVLSENGAVISRVPIPGRGHDISFDPTTSRAVAFARRPGTFALVLDATSGKAIKLILAEENRHFFGHGTFSPDGRLLYVAENDFDHYEGRIGLYDARSAFRKIGEFSAYGMDTHDLQIMEGGRYLAVANGGIKQHPSTGRAKLNLGHMQPSLVILDTSDGRLLEKHELPEDLRQLSTRHMDIDGTGQIWFGCQFEGPRNRNPQLLGRFRRGEEISFLEIPEPVLKGFDNYIGSVMTNRAHGLVAISSPAGGQWAAFDTKTGRLVLQERLQATCGLSPAGETFVRSTETGLFGNTMSTLAWDNHITPLV